jgi:hypothetical protein
VPEGQGVGDAVRLVRGADRKWLRGVGAAAGRLADHFRAVQRLQRNCTRTPPRAENRRRLAHLQPSGLAVDRLGIVAFAVAAPWSGACAEAHAQVPVAGGLLAAATCPASSGNT